MTNQTTKPIVLCDFERDGMPLEERIDIGCAEWGQISRKHALSGDSEVWTADEIESHAQSVRDTAESMSREVLTRFEWVESDLGQAFSDAIITGANAYLKALQGQEASDE